MTEQVEKVEMVPIYQALGHAFEWLGGILGVTSTRWQAHCNAWIDHLETLLPSGSGIDNGTTIDREKSTGHKLVFFFGYHPMNEHGYYEDWIEYTMTVVPTFSGFELDIIGPDRDDLKDSLYQTYEHALSEQTPRHHPKADERHADEK